MNRSVFSKIASKAKQVLAGVVTLGGAAASQAAVDGTTFAADLSANDAALVLVGGALIGLAVTAVGFKWVKGMIFG